MGGPEYNYGFNEKSAQMGTLTYQSLTLDTDLAIYQISQITFTICNQHICCDHIGKSDIFAK